MIIHIIQDSVYANDFIKFLGTCYRKENHFVYVIANDESHIVENEKNCPWRYFVNKDILEFNNKARKAEKVIIHGLFDTILFGWLLVHLFNLKKVIISIWGGDLYVHRTIMEDINASFESKLIDAVRGLIFRRIPLFLNDMAEDYSLLKEWYHVKGKSIHILYPASVDVDFLENAISKKNKHPSKTIILLGNSATETNKHIEALNLLRKYKGENIEIYCPLSYGSKEYGEKIVQLGIEMFGDKFIPLTQFMEPNEYCRLLASVDIALFNNNRQQAMGNIALLGYLGSKIYLRNDTTMWEQYVEKGKCGFHCINEIEHLSFNEFSLNSMQDQLSNKRYFSQLWDTDYLKRMWDEVFE